MSGAPAWLREADAEDPVSRSLASIERREAISEAGLSPAGARRVPQSSQFDDLICMSWSIQSWAGEPALSRVAVT